MKISPLLLGASVLFWGWQINIWIMAIFLALVIEGAWIIQLRWDLSFSDLKRISDTCTFIFIGTIIWFAVYPNSNRLIYRIIQWLPISFSPLIIAQCYSFKDQLDIRPFSLILRKQEKIKPPILMNLTYPYFTMCILSASAANIKTEWFYPGLFLLCSSVFLSVRTKRYSLILWINLLIFAGLLGYGGQIGLRHLQLFLEQKSLEWFFNLENFDANPYQSITAIGDIGVLKQSDRILFRVITDDIQKKSIISNPLLMRETSYSMYGFSKWFAPRHDFKQILPEPDQTTWKLDNIQGTGKKVTVAANLKNGKGILKLPNGTFVIKDLSVSNMSKNFLGTVKVEADSGVGLISYQVEFNSDISKNANPEKEDLFIPEKEKKILSQIADQLSLRLIPPDKVLNKIENFFEQNFSYSLVQNFKYEKNQSPLSDFLQKTKSGHCEYFATATILILRSVGIPARYATGYMVHEFSPWEKKFVVRQKDAHAWTMVYLNGAWQDFDTTPSTWSSPEKNTLWKTISDIWSWGAFSISSLHWDKIKDELKDYMKWLVIPLTLFLLRRLYIPEKGKRINKTKKIYSSLTDPLYGIDSYFYQIETFLKESGYERKPWEPLSKFIQKIEKEHPSEIDISGIWPILKLHYRYRFDPKGLLPDEKKIFITNVQNWLLQHKVIA